MSLFTLLKITRTRHLLGKKGVQSLAQPLGDVSPSQLEIRQEKGQVIPFPGSLRQQITEEPPKNLEPLNLRKVGAF